MASKETQQDGATATQRIRAMQQARPSMTFPNAGAHRFVQRFLKEVPEASEIARQNIGAAGAAVAPSAPQAPVPQSPGHTDIPLSITQLREVYQVVQARPHSLTPAQVEELQALMRGEG
jgi:hypothetical protein